MYLDKLTIETSNRGFTKDEHKYVGNYLSLVSFAIKLLDEIFEVYRSEIERENMAAHILLETNVLGASMNDEGIVVGVRGLPCALLEQIRERGPEEKLQLGILRQVIRQYSRVIGGAHCSGDYAKRLADEILDKHEARRAVLQVG